MFRWFVLSESDLIQLIRERVFHSPQMSQDFQDDCAWIDLQGRSSAAFVFSTDLLIEDVHFRRSTISALDLGWKTLAVNLSDLASKGARPVGFSLGWSLPKDLGREWINDFLKGLDECARHYGCPMIGGDTTGGEKISLAVSVLGEAFGASSVARRNAQAGDLLVVTGQLGESDLGLQVLENPESLRSLPLSLRERVVRRHRRPEPRLQMGEFLVRQGVRAMMDLSDGVFQDVSKFAGAAGCGFQVQVADLPIAEDLKDVLSKKALESALFGGEDYELLFSFKAESLPALKNEAQSLGLSLSPIGYLVADRTQTWAEDVVRDSLKYGFKHFS